jgi:hypothetical protein
MKQKLFHHIKEGEYFIVYNPFEGVRKTVFLYHVQSRWAFVKSGVSLYCQVLQKVTSEKNAGYLFKYRVDERVSWHEVKYNRSFFVLDEQEIIENVMVMEV